MERMNFLTYLANSESDNGRSGPILEGQLIKDANGLKEYGGFRPVTDRNLSQRGILEARRLFDRMLTGDRWAALRFQEAMTTSDFSTYFGNVLDRSVLANYAETPYTWDLYAKRATIRDFRQAQIFRFDRGGAVLDGPINPSLNAAGISAAGPTGLAEVTEYPMRKRVASRYVDQLYKFGALMDFSWETIVNDDLDALRDTPALLGRAARRTEESRATRLFATATGPNATFFSVANKNILTSAVNPIVTTNNAPFNIESLQQAMTIIASQRDLDGEPISIENFVLVYPPALKVPVKNVLSSTQVLLNVNGGTVQLHGTGATQTAYNSSQLLAENWARLVVTPAENYYLPIVDTTYGNTAWYLFANPRSGRPAMQQSFLLGREAPELFMKASNAIAIGEGRMGAGSGSVGGQMTSPLDGDFDTDSVIYKIRSVIGGTLLDPLMALASNGSGN